MSRRHRRPRVVRTATLTFAVLAASVSGCAQSSPLLTQRTTVGTLKASVSRLEYENQQIRSELKGALADNHDLEDRLVREESLNGELSARLDDARAVLSRRGDIGGATDDGFDRASIDPPARTLPAGRTEGTQRKPPFARIPGRVDPAPRPEPYGGSLRPAPTRTAPIPESDPGSWRGEPQSSSLDSRVWLPIAVGASSPSGTVR